MFRSSLSRLAAYAPSYVAGTDAVAEPAVAPAPGVSVDKLGVEDTTRQFDFGRLVSAFEAVTFPPGAPPTLPHTASFLAAMDEVLLLFDHLGAAFAFVRRDIATKTSLLRAYTAASPDRFVSLSPPILAEKAAGSPLPGGPGAGRTLLRLMWALKFIDCLLAYLHEVKRPGTKLAGEAATLRAGVAHAYAEALAEHHSWALRKTVKAALALLPSADVFLDKVCPEERLREPYLSRLARSMTPLRETMYAFYAQHDLLGLP